MGASDPITSTAASHRRSHRPKPQDDEAVEPWGKVARFARHNLSLSLLAAAAALLLLSRLGAVFLPSPPDHSTTPVFLRPNQASRGPALLRAIMAPSGTLQEPLRGGPRGHGPLAVQREAETARIVTRRD
ncbi:hypothetical protein FSOLCH5_002402 [Fusarium solani]